MPPPASPPPSHTRGPAAAAAALSVAALLALTVGCAPTGDNTIGPSSTTITAHPTASATASGTPVRPSIPGDIVTGLRTPWSMVSVGSSVLVDERDTGRILEITDDGTVREVATVTGILFGGEGGLLGLATDPAHTHLYAYSTAPSGNRVQRFDLHGEPGSVSLGAPADILTGLPAASNHNGGRIGFGPDGMLYVTVGDAGDSAAAQDLHSLAGKILRLTPGGDIPADNPFPNSAVYSYGHRNPQGIAWAADGRLFASEFGQNTWDELNVITAGGNYGWPIVEGMDAAGGAFIDPVQVWAPADASPSGVAIAGDMLYMANLRGARLHAVPIDDPSRSRELLVGTYGRLRAVMLAPDGRLWVTTSNEDGRGDPRPGDDRITALDLPGGPAAAG